MTAPTEGHRLQAEGLWHDLINEDDRGAVEKLALLLQERNTALAKLRAVEELRHLWTREGAEVVPSANLRRALGGES